MKHEPVVPTEVGAHSSECKRWYLAFQAAKTFLQQAQKNCPACQVKRGLTKQGGRL